MPSGAPEFSQTPSLTRGSPILVTGSAGFIGFHLARALLDEGHEVVGYDNFNDYYSVQLKRDRHAILQQYSRYRGVEADLCDGASLNPVFDASGFEVVCHLAAQAGVRYSLTHPHVYQRSNLEGFLNILEACRHHGVGRLVYASSSSVYGGNTKLPFSETDPVDTPISLYAATKKANELMAHTYSHLYGLQTVGLRFFTVYGPWGRPDMAMWLFTAAMLEGRPIPVFNHGDMRRDFTYIDDIVAGAHAALFAKCLSPCEVFNLGNHRSEHLLDMIQILGDLLGVEPRMTLLPMQPGDVQATYADIDRARTALGFEPTTPISAGIPRFVSWYRDYHADPQQAST
ncbi:NAD-dependent epimerase/dehydratase family protein [Candidatus Fermentibacteria bacterium]|nr:NAD-dependent epimerase/dehydratase family protein [Candidatus Fermentibacteria bacterium]